MRIKYGMVESTTSVHGWECGTPKNENLKHKCPTGAYPLGSCYQIYRIGGQLDVWLAVEMTGVTGVYVHRCEVCTGVTGVYVHRCQVWAGCLW